MNYFYVVCFMLEHNYPKVETDRILIVQQHLLSFLGVGFIPSGNIIHDKCVTTKIFLNHRIPKPEIRRVRDSLCI